MSSIIMETSAPASISMVKFLLSTFNSHFIGAALLLFLSYVNIGLSSSSSIWGRESFECTALISFLFDLCILAADLQTGVMYLILPQLLQVALRKQQLGAVWFDLPERALI